MKVKNLFGLLLLSLTVFMSACDGDDIDLEVKEGVGSLTYDGHTYPLNTFILWNSSAHNAYSHTAVLSHSKEESATFGFSVLDQNTDLVGGTYTVTRSGQATANFSLESGVGDIVVGTLTITNVNGVYNIQFIGTTVDESLPIREVKLEYQGEKINK